MEHSDNLAYCREAAAPPGSGLYYACLFLAPGPRERVITLHAYEAELQRSLEASEDPGVIRLRLQWWREELQRAATGQARHPVGRALQGLLESGWLRIAELQTCLQARERELDPPARHENFTELLQALTAGPGQLWYLSGRLCGLEDEHALAAAARFGGLHWLFAALQNLAMDLHRGCCPSIPGSEWLAAGLQPETAAVNPEPWQRLLEWQFRRLLDHMQTGLDNMPVTFAGTAPHAPILIGLDIALCREILNDGCDVMHKRYALTPLRKLWVAWRTSRRL